MLKSTMLSGIFWGFVLAGFLACGPALLGQVITGTILGRITDPTGAVIPEATVTVTKQATNVSLTTETQEGGEYAVSLLPIGAYTVSVSLDGFKTSIVRDLRVTQGSSIRVDVTLELGTIAETAEVVATAGMLETSNAQVSHSVEGRGIRELPIVGRDILRLATLGPGVVQRQTNSIQRSVGGDYLGSNSPTVAGGRAEAVSYTFGGINVNNRRVSVPMEKPALDTVDEFTVLTNNYSAEYGQGDGQVLIEFRSGANELHGSVYNYFRNDALNARGFFDDRKEKERFNQFGVAVGGPIIRDRSFFFVNYEGIRNPASEILGGLFPTSELLAGDFSDFRDANGNVIPIFDPATTDPVTGQRQQFAGNVIPSGQISPIARNLYEIYGAPTPRSLPPGAGNNVLENLSRNQPVDQFSIKIDHHFAGGDALSTRYSFTDPRTDNENITQASSAANSLRNQVIGQTWTHVFSSAILNEFRVGYARQRTVSIPQIEIIEQDLQSVAGIPNPLPFNFLPTIFFQSATGTPSFNQLNGVSGAGSSGEVQQHYQIVDNFSWVRGKHSLRFGTDIRRRLWDTIGVQPAGGASLVTRGIFTGQLEPDPDNPGAFRGMSGTGAPLADFLLGQLESVDYGIGRNIFAFRDWVVAFYVQDTWQVTPRFTLNLGLRWDYQSPITDKFGRQSFVVKDSRCPDGCLLNDGTFGGTVDPITNPFPGEEAISPGGIRSDTNNFGPRIGLAYRLSDRTVIRAGGGMYFGLWGQNNFANPSQPPFGSGFTLNPSITDTRDLAQFTQAQHRLDNIYPPLPQPGSTPPGLFINHFFDINNVQPEYINATLAVQHALTPELSVEVGYLGKFSHHLPNFENQNPCTIPLSAFLFPPCDLSASPVYTTFNNFGAVVMNASNGTSNYNGGYVEVQKRFSHGLHFLASYTWSKTMSRGFDSVGNDIFLGGTYVEPLIDWRKRSPKLSVLDVPHRFVAHGIYELPFGHGKVLGSSVSGALKHFIEDWQVSWIVAFQSGPVVDLSGLGFFAKFKPGRSEELKRLDFRKTGLFFDPDLFQLFSGDPVPFNHFRGAGINNWDLSISKRIRVTENQRLQFRVEFFNAWNHGQFETPGNFILNPGFGTFQPTNASFGTNGARPSRTIQLGLKYIF